MVTFEGSFHTLFVVYNNFLGGSDPQDPSSVSATAEIIMKMIMTRVRPMRIELMIYKYGIVTKCLGHQATESTQLLYSKGWCSAHDPTLGCNFLMFLVSYAPLKHSIAYPFEKKSLYLF